MAFVAAKCPQCGGVLQVDDEKENGFCMHCGSKILIQHAINLVRIDYTHMVSNWMRMGNSALEVNNFEEAYTYFTKVVENDPNNWKGLILKGYAAGYLSNFFTTRFNEFFQGINDALKLLEKLNLQEKDKSELFITIAECIHNLTISYDSYAKRFMRGGGGKNIDNIQLYSRLSEIDREKFKYMSLGLSFVNNLDDEEGKAIKLKIQKALYYWCKEECNEYVPIEKKQHFIDLYDELGDEIRKTEPNFEKDDFIDRIESADISHIYGDARKKQNKKLQEKINQEKEYWNKIPNGYKAHVNELKNKKNYLLSEIEKETTILEDIKFERRNLKDERTELGFFDGARKNEIDLKIRELEAEFDKHYSLINNFKRSLSQLNQ